MDPNDHLRLMIGDLVMQVAHLRAMLAAKDAPPKDEEKPDEPV